jgi:uncharacterized integral membrane protein
VSDQEREPTTLAEETRRDRSLRYSQRTGLWVALVIAIAVIVFLILLVARNTRQVKLDYVFNSTQTALIWLIVISAICGWVLGIATSFLVRHRTRRRV